MKVISIENEKGGVGKSTTTVNLASCFGLAGYKVLVIDLSSQANSTKTLLANRTVFHHQEIKNSIHGLLTGQKGLTIEKAIRATREENVFLIPGHHLMKRAELEIMPLMDSHRALKRLARDIQELEYDFIVVDTPPEIQFIKQMAAMAADMVIIPVLPSEYALDGIEGMVIDLAQVAKMRGENLEIRILLCQTENDIETTYAKKLLDETYPNNLFSVDIPKRRMVKTAQRHNKSVVSYAGKSDASIAYAQLAQEVLMIL